MISAAPRLAEAVVLGRSVASTVDRETVVEEEARRHRLIPGDSFWGVGLMGTIASGIAKPGYSIQGWYETGAVGSELWGSGGEDDEGDSFLFVAWGIGGRARGTSPYLGGGFTRVWASYERWFLWRTTRRAVVWEATSPEAWKPCDSPELASGWNCAWIGPFSGWESGT